ncbi:quinone-dependent dihydroorotate dehydrogenase [Bacillus altitudinis]|uniref:quinone-dependent dihydroorotate dehydrogenase n=1 Tax=Bacillus altitudinis TaxID=293387 RepID=UPI0011E91AC5|nr:quinone-dependent dihydroorotate dehydrogenase [Bacillus altitudinis]TYS29048.1 quinone-dependent dihydroorotate dehydrogenase [Bacillus altitudinis]
MYGIIRNLLFKMDPEKAHSLTIQALKVMQSFSIIRKLYDANMSLNDSRLECKLLDITFPNPVGLAAGFDKFADVFPALASLGFGSVEVGSITPNPQPGNPKPRLYRLPEDTALINRMGFNSEGVNKAKQNFLTLPRPSIPLGINLGKNKNSPNQHANLDYQQGLETLYTHGDYFVINISSPNTEGLRDLQYIDTLKPLLSSILNKRDELCEKNNQFRPIVLKIAPDLTPEQLEGAISVILEVKVDAVIAANTTIYRNNLTSKHQKQNGGLSGKPLNSRSTEIISKIYLQTQGKLPIIGSGGVFTGEDAYEKIKSGASLVQLYTSMIYQGPSIAKQINQEILNLLEKDGLSNITEAIGLYHK